MKLQSLLLFTLLLSFQLIAQQENLEKNIDTKTLDKLFESWNSNTITPGASIAVIRNGSVIIEKAYGYANLEFNIKNTSSTLFNIASNSKQFTVFAILNLEQEGKLSLEDDIRKYIPELPDFEKKITIKNLAQHTHGIRGITYLLGMAGWRIEDLITREANLEILTNQKELNFSPGTDFSYNNSGYILLAEIIERVSGKPFHEYLNEIIFTPLRMKETTLFNDYKSIIPNLSNPYYFDGKAYKKGIRNSKDIVGNTGIRTNIQDLRKWLVNFEKPIIGNSKIFKKMERIGLLKNGDTLGYSMGLIVSNYKGKRVISHGGADAGYRSQILRFPEEQVSIIVLANDGSLNADEKAFKIADIYFNNSSSPDTLKTVSDTQPNKLISKELLRRYEGKFELQPGFIMEFKEKGKTLYITATGQGTFPLETINEQQFKIRRIGAIITFIENENGNFDILTFNHNQQKITGNKIKFAIDKTDLEKYTGVYYSEELKTSYTLHIKNGHLVASHQRQEDTVLTPLDKQKFSGNTWFFGNLEYQFSDKEIIGFKVSSDRVQNLWFKKVK